MHTIYPYGLNDRSSNKLEQQNWKQQNRLLIWYCFKRRLTPSAAFDELRTSLEEQAPSFADGSIPYQQLTLTVSLSDLNSHTE